MMTRHPLGRNREHDPRSRDFEHPVRRLPARRNVTHRLRAPHLDQGDLGACEGFTAAEFLDCALALRNRQRYNQADRSSRGDNRRYLDSSDGVRLYGAATRCDNDEIPGVYPPADTGTSGVGVAKAMQQLGAIDRYNWTFSFEAFLATLQTQPVMLGVDWFDGFMEVDHAGHIRLGEDDDLAGGHAVLAFVRDWVRRRTGCTNHWVNDDGTPWGVRIGGHPGCFWVDDELLEWLLIDRRGESLVPVLGP